WRWQLLPWALVMILSLTVALLAAAYFRRPRPQAHLVRFQIPLPEHLTFDVADFPVVSPNGERLVFAGRGPDGKRHLWVRSLDSNYVGGGAWSRDGVILVSTGTDHTLYRVSAAGGELKRALPTDKSLPYNDFPQFLPDGRHFLYCSKKETPAVGKTAIYVASLD